MRLERKIEEKTVSLTMEVRLAAAGDENGNVRSFPAAGHSLWDDHANWSMVAIQKSGDYLPIECKAQKDKAGKRIVSGVSKAHEAAGEYVSVQVLDDGAIIFQHNLDPALPIAAGQTLALAFIVDDVPDDAPRKSSGTAAGTGATAKVVATG